jgi:hypothetical protein
MKVKKVGYATKTWASGGIAPPFFTFIPNGVYTRNKLNMTANMKSDLYGNIVFTKNV